MKRYSDPMSDGGPDDLLARQKEFFSSFFRKGAELAEELLRDNERLVTEVQALGRRYEERLQQIERENHNLASLYVSAYQLHGSLEPPDVLRTIVEILSNFLGAKTFGVYLVEGGKLRPAAAEGVDLASLADLDPAQPITVPSPSGLPPVAARTLRLRDKTVGAVVIWELLTQKGALDDVDIELLNLLGGHAAIALEAARLHAGASGPGGRGA